jgi:hypothetical protein
VKRENEVMMVLQGHKVKLEHGVKKANREKGVRREKEVMMVLEAYREILEYKENVDQLGKME